MKDMPEMSAARCCRDLGAHHAVRKVLVLCDQSRIDRTRERRPAAARVIFIRGDKERLARRDITVDARAELVIVCVAEGRLCRLFLRDGLLDFCQACP